MSTTSTHTATALTSAAPSDGRFLRRWLRLDAVASGVLGLAALAAAPALADATGIGTGWLRGVGAFLALYAAGLVLLAAVRPAVPRGAAWVVVVGNLVWAVDTAVLGVLRHGDLTAFGLVVVLGQAAAVLVFAELQWLGLRRSRA